MQLNFEYFFRIFELDFFVSGEMLINLFVIFVFDICFVEIINFGVFIIIQDGLGCIDIGYGVFLGGFMDDFSVNIVNILVGNIVGVEFFEVILIGFEILFY